MRNEAERFMDGLEMCGMDSDNAGLFERGDDGIWFHADGNRPEGKPLFYEELDQELRAKPERRIEGEELEALAASKGLEVATAEDIAADNELRAREHELTDSEDGRVREARRQLQQAESDLYSAELQAVGNPTHGYTSMNRNRAQGRYDRALERYEAVVAEHGPGDVELSAYGWGRGREDAGES